MDLEYALTKELTDDYIRDFNNPSLSFKESDELNIIRRILCQGIKNKKNTQLVTKKRSL